MTLLLVGLVVVCLLATAVAQATHPRPIGATPTRLSLVPSYAQCTAPDRTHGPPLAFPSCNPPAQTSSHATIGTPDAYGGAPSFSGSLTFLVYVGPPGPPDDSDVRIKIDVADIRCAPASPRCGSANDFGPADYSGDMRFDFAVRMTDHYNSTTAGGGTDAATVQDTLVFGQRFACVGTASTSTGSTCTTHASMLAIVPGSVKDGKRVLWEILDVKVADGGADGDGDTTADNTVFARPGVFIP